MSYGPSFGIVNDSYLDFGLHCVKYTSFLLILIFPYKGNFVYCFRFKEINYIISIERKMARQYYIIMADVIDSRSISKDDGFMDAFKSLIQKANSTFAAAILSPLTITLGDEFQGVVATKKVMLDLVFYLDEQLLALNLPFKLRYALVYGEIETPINTKIAHEMYGSGLTQAREGLASLKDTTRHFFVHLAAYTDTQLQLSLYLYQNIKSGWKSSESEIISAFLTHKDYKKLQELGLYKTRSGAWKKYNSLQMEAYNTIKTLILNIIANERT